MHKHCGGCGGVCKIKGTSDGTATLTNTPQTQATLSRNVVPDYTFIHWYMLVNRYCCVHLARRRTFLILMTNQYVKQLAITLLLGLVFAAEIV